MLVEQWKHENQSEEWKQAHIKLQQLDAQHQNLCTELENHQGTLESIEMEQEHTLLKFEKKKSRSIKGSKTFFSNDAKDHTSDFRPSK